MNSNSMVVRNVSDISEFERIKQERDYYKMMYEIQKPRYEAAIVRNTKHARRNYAVKKPSLPVRIVLGGCGLVTLMFTGLFKGIENIADVLVNQMRI